MRDRPQQELGEFCILSAGLLLFWWSLAGLFLALTGWFSTGPIWGVAVLSLPIVALSFSRWSRHAIALDNKSASPVGRTWVLVRVALLLGALVLYGRPDGNILGNWDPGVYVAQGARIAQVGSYHFEDSAATVLLPEERDALYGTQWGARIKHPGFYAPSLKTGQLEPQFYPLYPVWLAYAFWAGGLKGLLMAGWLFPVLSVLLIAEIGRRLAGTMGGVIAALLLMCNPVQIWFGGFHTAEPLMQCFFLFGVWAWLQWQGSGRWEWAVLAGALSSMVMFVSVTGLWLVGLIILAHALYLCRPRAGFFYLPFLIALPLSAWQNLVFTPSYFQGILPFQSVLTSSLRHGLPVLLVVLVIALLLYLRSRVRSSARYLLAAGDGVALVALLALAWGLYGGSASSNRALMMPALMLSKTGVLLAASGVWLLLRRQAGPAGLTLLVALVFTLPFLRVGMMVDLYPWAWKRFLAVTLPIGCLAIGYAWSRVADLRKDRRWALAVLVLALFLGLRPLYRGRMFAFHRAWQGAPAALAAVAENIPEESLVLAEKWAATPLEFIWNKMVLPTGPQERDAPFTPPLVGTIDRILAEGQRVVLVSQPAKRPSLPWPTKVLGEHELRTSVLSQTRKPFQGVPRGRVVNILVEELIRPEEGRAVLTQ